MAVQRAQQELQHTAEEQFQELRRWLHAQLTPLPELVERLYAELQRWQFDHRRQFKRLQEVNLQLRECAQERDEIRNLYEQV